MSPSKVIKSKALSKKSRKSVQFSLNVSLRSCIPKRNFLPNEQYSTWFSARQLRTMKAHAKHLAIRFRLAEDKRSAIGDTSHSNCDSSRYEIKGESLRGMEHMTDSVTGIERQFIKTEAIHAAVEEQRTQGSSGVGNVVDSRRRVAEIYKKKSRKALLFARKVAEEDAKVAAAILEEDLTPLTPLKRLPVQARTHASTTSVVIPKWSKICQHHQCQPKSMEPNPFLLPFFSAGPLMLPQLRINTVPKDSSNLQLLVAIALNSTNSTAA